MKFNPEDLRRFEEFLDEDYFDLEYDEEEKNDDSQSK